MARLHQDLAQVLITVLSRLYYGTRSPTLPNAKIAERPAGIATRHLSSTIGGQTESQSDDDFTIDKFPRFVRTFYELHCGTFTHKHGVSWPSSSTIRYFAGSKEGISDVPKLKREIRGDLYVKSLRLFAEYDDWDRHNPAIDTIIANQNAGGESVLTSILERPFQVLT